MTRHGRFFLIHQRAGGHNRGPRGPPSTDFETPSDLYFATIYQKAAASLEHIIRYYCAKSGVNRTSSLAGTLSQRFGTRRPASQVRKGFTLTQMSLRWLRKFITHQGSGTLFIPKCHIKSMSWVCAIRAHILTLQHYALSSWIEQFICNPERSG